MFKHQKLIPLFLSVSILLLIIFSYAFGGVKIILKDGKVIDISVNKEDIAKIIFEEDAKDEAKVTYLSDLEPSNVKVGWGTREERDIFAGKYKIILGGITYKKGLHTHAPASVSYMLNRKYSKFESYIGLWDSENPNRGKTDDFAGTKGSVIFQVLLDGKKQYDSGLMHWDDTKHISISVNGVNKMDLVVDDVDGYDYDWAIWGDAKLMK